MPSVLSAASPSTTPTAPKKTLRNVLGFGTLDGRPRSSSPAIFSDDDEPVLITTQPRQASVTDKTFFAQAGSPSPADAQQPSASASFSVAPTSPPDSPRSTASSLQVEEMNIDLDAASNQPHSEPPQPLARSKSKSKPNFRFAPQWGPWAVSVAETPTDPNTYNIYIKTPTHNYTLTRAQTEVIELHTKLRDSFPTAVLPAFPLANVAPAPSGKRRSSFLHTLSRFTTSNSSSSSKLTKGGRPSTAGPEISTNSPTTGYPTPSNSPPAEENTTDPFNDQQTVTGTGNATTALAGYLTSIANDQKIRGARVWKRFIRVRTDDLESVRVERAIKRVRSDLAMHTSPSVPSTNRLEVNGNNGTSMLSLGPEFGAGAFGLTSDGGFQSELEAELGSTSEIPSKSTSNADVAHTRDETEKAPPTPVAQPQPTVENTKIEDKRVSSIMNVTSAFSSDSHLADSVRQAAAVLGSAPTTPTPATTELPPPQETQPQPEDVALPPSPAGDAKKEAEPDVTAPAHSRIPRSASADPDQGKAWKRFKTPAVRAETADSVDGDTSVAEGTTTDADAHSVTTAPKKRKKSGRKPSKKVNVDDFDMLRVLGKGCAGKVLLVKYKKTSDLYALKAITKRHVLAHQELQHTLTEQAVLKRMSRENKDPFVVKLWWSFHDKDNLFLVMDFHPGGDLATQLARWGRLGRDRARFYAAEIVEGVEGLHAAGVIYRDLKPENILIGADGHIVLTDFGLSKEFPRRSANSTVSAVPTPNGSNFGGDYWAASGTPATPWGEEQQPWSSARDLTSTFCGTAEYLAPEVIQGLPYSYEVDWWSFGTMLYEMLSGITPFWANNHSDMYVRVLQDELQFPEDRAMDQDTKSLIRGLLQRNPALRMTEPRVKRHPYFSMIDWDHVYYKRYIPPYIPPIDPHNASDTQNFDETFLEMVPTIDNEDHASESERDKTEDEDAKSDGEELAKKSDVGEKKEKPPVNIDTDVFDGYSFKGRHSVLIDEEDDEGYADDEPEDEELIEAKKVTDELAARGAAVAVHRDDVSDAGTIEQPKEEEGSFQEAVSATPSTSTVPESAVTASISTEADSVSAPKSSKEKQPSDGSTLPSLTAGTTATTSSGDLAESPVLNLESPITKPVTNKLITEDNFVYDEAIHAPLPLSPVIEAVDPATGKIVEEETLPAADANFTSKIPVKASSTLPKAAPSTPIHTQRAAAGRREKSGIPALDRARLHHDEEDATEREEDDWDVVETPQGMDRNGAKGLSLWQRGVVDRYRLVVSGMRKNDKSHSSTRTPRSTHDSPSATASPSPSDVKHRRGRTGGISLRKSTRDFLRAKSPSATFSAQSNAASRASLAQLASGNADGSGLLTPSPSMPVVGRPVPSLKSKSSALSKASGGGSPPSSDQSATDLRQPASKSTSQISSPLRSPVSPRLDARSPVRGERTERQTGFNKMRNGAEKVMSLFSPPRHHPPQQQQS